MVFFESVHRVEETLRAMAEVFGEDRPAAVARELTKLYEEVVDASVAELARLLADGELATRGEFVLVVAGNPDDGPKPAINVDALLLDLVDALPGKQAAAIVARATGESRNAMYRRMLELKGSR